MKKRFIFKNDMYPSTTGIMHGQKPLSTFLTNIIDRFLGLNNAYWIGWDRETITGLQGNKSHVWSAMTPLKQKNISYDVNTITFKVDGLYWIHVFVHLNGATVRSFVTLNFTNGGDFCPKICRSQDTQGMANGGSDPVYELNKIVAIKAGTKMTIDIWGSGSTFSLMGSTNFDTSASGLTIYKIGEYPN